MKKEEYTNDLNPTIQEDFFTAHEQYKSLRANCPVAYSTHYNGFWALFKYDDIVNVLKNPQTFVTSVQNVVPKVAATGRRPPLHLDPPEHTVYRKPLAPFFSEKRMKQIEPYIQKSIIQLLDSFIEKRGGDICEEFSRKLPGYVFEKFFNIPRQYATSIREITKVYVTALHEQNDEAVQQASKELYRIAQTLINMRKENPLDPKEDVFSAYLAIKELPEDMVLGTVRQLIVVGMIAPTIFIGSMTVHLALNPNIQNEIRNNLHLVEAAIEEYLRLLTPYRGFARTAKHDCVIGGRTIRKDEPIALVFSSANRDETIFPNPDQFILNRPNIKKHIAFGLGPHRCPGAPLARIILNHTLYELLSRTKSIELNGEVKMSRWPEWGVTSAQIKVTPNC